MSTQIRVPDIGVDKAEVIELLVQPGDSVEAEQGLVMVESDKASMEIPAPFAGTVVSLQVKVGDSISEGSDLARLETQETASTSPEPAPESTATAPAAPQPSESPAPAPAAEIELVIPDLGVDSATVIEVLAQPGDSVEAEQGLIMVESDKASMEIPAPQSGVLSSLLVKVGDSIASNQPLGTLQPAAASTPASAPAASPAPASAPAASPASAQLPLQVQLPAHL